jgi:nucleotide-binding universal stress UspA family protein
MSVGVGYLPTPEGRAALGHAVSECTVRGDDLVVMLTTETAGSDNWGAELDRARAALGGQQMTVRDVTNERAFADELVALSYEDDIDLLVIGLRRRSPVGKLVLGSISQQVLLDAQCPVTAVKPPVVPATQG